MRNKPSLRVGRAGMHLGLCASSLLNEPCWRTAPQPQSHHHTPVNASGQMLCTTRCGIAAHPGAAAIQHNASATGNRPAKSCSTHDWFARMRACSSSSSCEGHLCTPWRPSAACSNAAWQPADPLLRASAHQHCARKLAWGHNRSSSSAVAQVLHACKLRGACSSYSKRFVHRLCGMDQVKDKKPRKNPVHTGGCSCVHPVGRSGKYRRCHGGVKASINHISAAAHPQHNQMRPQHCDGAYVPTPERERVPPV